MAHFDIYGVEFSDDRKTLVKCPEDFHGAYTIPDGVTKIKRHAFMLCSDIISIVIPDSVIEIEQEGIRSCRNLQSIVIGEGVVQMEDCLVGCDSLCSVVCHSNMRFSNCDLLRDTEWYQLQPDGAVIIGSTLIKYKLSPNEQLKEYKLPDNVLYIAEGAFDDCKDLESIDFNNAIIVECLLPDGVSSINASGNALQETESFDNTIWFKNQQIGFVNIGPLLYEYKTDNEKYPRIISIPENISAINKQAFYALRRCKDDMCDGIEPFIVICNETLTTIGESAFEGSAISEIILSQGLRTIQDKAFSISLLNSINLPESIEKIGEEAFAECKLTSIHIPSSVTRIPKRAFYGNHSLVNVSLSPFVSGINEIGEAAFAECDIRSIHIPSTVRKIGYKAFYNNRGLENIFISEGVETIESCAFAANNALGGFDYLMIPSTIRVLEDAFERRSEGPYRWDENKVEVLVVRCDINNYRWASRFGSKLKTVIFNEGVTVIPSYCFMECTVLKNVILPTSLQTINEGVFQGCESLETLTLPHNIKEIWSSSLPQNIKKVIVSSGQLLLKIGAYGKARYNYYIEKNVFVDANGNSITPELMIYKLGNRNDNGLHCYKGDLYDIEIVKDFEDPKPKDDSDVYDNSDKPSYSQYGGYNGYDDDTIDSAFEGDPEATWNVD